MIINVIIQNLKRNNSLTVYFQNVLAKSCKLLKRSKGDDLKIDMLLDFQNDFRVTFDSLKGFFLLHMPIHSKL